MDRFMHVFFSEKAKNQFRNMKEPQQNTDKLEILCKHMYQLKLHPNFESHRN